MHVILILRFHLIHSQRIKEVNLKAEVFLVITELQFYLNLWASILLVKFTVLRIHNLDKKFMKISVPIYFFLRIYSIQYSSNQEFSHKCISMHHSIWWRLLCKWWKCLKITTMFHLTYNLVLMRQQNFTKKIIYCNEFWLHLNHSYIFISLKYCMYSYLC